MIRRMSDKLGACLLAAGMAWVVPASLVPATAQAAAMAQRKVMILVPDDLAADTVGLRAWLDAASEEGYELATVTDSQFLAAGSAAPARYAGLIVPDGIHTRASNALVNALQAYAQAGGHLMVVFDAASLTDTGFFAVPRSRLSDLVGVDYVLYDELRDRTVGLGPVQGAVNTLRDLQVPPGKSIAVQPEAPSATAAYLVATAADPGATRQFDAAKIHRDAAWQATLDALLTLASNTQQQRATAQALSQQRLAQALAPVSAVTTNVAATFSPQHVISGYGYGALTYPSYVTRGDYSGLTLLSSAQHGLVAGRRAVGSGDVTFYNLPLTYLKLSTDGLPMHGAIGYFMGKVVQAPRLLTVPNGKAGITLNWHLDSNLALKPMQQLEAKGVWLDGPFSMHMTAGPDTIAFGDGIGFDLPNNPEAKRLMRTFKLLGHGLGSHGGWIHDHYGYNVNDINQAEYEALLDKNRQAVDAVVGKTVEYSAPLGNNPQWTMDWNEARGVRSAYFLGHTGMTATRMWREGDLRNPSMWAVPVVPYGKAATFEEFMEQGLPASEITAWYKDLVDFDIKYRTTRMVYMHPPGAMLYPDVLTSVLSYVRVMRWAGKVQWSTFNDQASFMSSRQQVKWSTSTGSTGRLRLDATHPDSLSRMTWLLPKAAFAKPVVLKGWASVDEDAESWLVRAWDVKSLAIEAASL